MYTLRISKMGSPLLSFLCSYIGDCEINVEVKKYFCKAGVNGIQVGHLMGK